MEPTEQAPTRRRRRRWLIVALLFVLVGVAWWNWPRGDARFVGKWSVFDGDDELQGGYLFQRNGALKIYGDVPESIYAPTGEIYLKVSKKVTFGTWSVSGDQLVIDSPVPPFFVPAIEWVDSYVSIPVLVERDEARISRISSDEITLRFPDGTEMKLRRVRE